MAIKLGDKVRDPVTGFCGTVTARAEYLSGCVQFMVEPSKVGQDGKPITEVWFDEQRLVVARSRKPAQPIEEKPTEYRGGPQPHPTRRPTPRARG